MGKMTELLATKEDVRERLKPFLVELARARQTEANLQDDVADLEAKIAASPDGLKLARLKEQLETAKEYTGLADVALRQATVEEFQRTGIKALLAGATVREYTVLHYTDEDALEYARQHLPQALKLDKKPFENVARVIELPFVMVEVVPKAIIARDLSGWLEG